MPALKKGLKQFTDQTRSITTQKLVGEKGQHKDLIIRVNASKDTIMPVAAKAGKP